jgi:TetR/AcrR family transcriptional regulator, transcriptional repressor for nem operon
MKHTAHMTRTGRPREFDEGALLDTAMRLFWDRGYERTAIGDLVAATGVLRGSLYAAYGDKRALFLATLDRYRQGWRAMMALPAEGPVLPALRAMLLGAVRASAAEGGRGCLVGNTIGEGMACDAAVREALRGTLEEVAADLAAALRRGQAAGELSAARPAEAQAWLVLAVLEGALLLARAGCPAAALEAMIEAALDGLRAVAPR